MYFLLRNVKLNYFICSEKLLMLEKYYYQPLLIPKVLNGNSYQQVLIHKALNENCRENSFNVTGVSVQKTIMNSKSPIRNSFEFTDLFLPLNVSDTQADAENKNPDIEVKCTGTMSYVSKIEDGDNFFTIDCLPSEVRIGSCYRKDKYKVKPRKNNLKVYKHNTFKNQSYPGTTDGKKSFGTSLTKDREDNTIIDDDINIVFEQSSGDFLSFQIERPNFFRENLLQSKQNKYVQKRNCHTKCEKCNKCKKSKKIKKKEGFKDKKKNCNLKKQNERVQHQTKPYTDVGNMSKNESDNDVIIEDDNDDIQILLDMNPKQSLQVSSILTVDNSPSKFHMIQREDSGKTNLEECEILDSNEIHYESKSELIDSSNNSKVVVPSTSAVENLNEIEKIEMSNLSIDLRQSVSDAEKKGDIEDEVVVDAVDDNYESISMDIEPDKISDTNKIDVVDSDFLPLEDIKLSDIEYSLQISDYVLDKRKRYENLRRWELTKIGQEFCMNINKPRGCLFTLLSYNVLAQKLLTDNMYLYKDCNVDHLDWVYRWSLFQHEIKHLQPDIMTFQEVESSHYHTHFLPWFTHLGYECVYKKRTGNKVDGCAIIFKSDKFTLIEKNSVEYFQPEGGPILDRDNVGLMVKLSPSSFHSPFCVATTHLLYNPKRQDVKLAQLVLFLTELDRICYENEKGGRAIYCPTIISGDFNADPYSAVLELVRRGRVEYAGLSKNFLSRINSYGPVFENDLLPASLGISDYCQHTVLEQGRFLEKSRGNLFSVADKRKLEESMIRLCHSEKNKSKSKPYATPYSLRRNFQSLGTVHQNFNFCSVYSHKLPRLRYAPEVTSKQNRWLTVDYIFYSRLFSSSESNGIEGPLKLFSSYGLISGSEAEAVGPLPSDICPSDHFPLAAQFLLEDLSR